MAFLEGIYFFLQSFNKSYNRSFTNWDAFF